MSDPKYLLYKGFRIADESDIGINLMYLKFDTDNGTPQFKNEAKHPGISEDGYVLYYTSQCPFNAKYVPIIEALAKERNVPFRSIHIDSKQQAQMTPCPCTSYALFYNGEFVTNEVLSDKRFLKMLEG